MSFTYVPSGGIIVFGCADVEYERHYTFKFAIGSIVYSLAHAQKGIFEKHAIKKVFIHNQSAPDSVYFTYLDTWNCIWMERELCSESDAISAVTAFYEREEEEIIEILENRSD